MTAEPTVLADLLERVESAAAADKTIDAALVAYFNDAMQNLVRYARHTRAMGSIL